MLKQETHSHYIWIGVFRNCKLVQCHILTHTDQLDQIVYMNCIEQIPSREGGEDVDPNIHYHIHKCLLLVPVLSHMKQVHTSHPISVRYISV
jgi:hypothetical protein